MTLRRQVVLWSGAIVALAAVSFAALALQIRAQRDAAREARRVRDAIAASATAAKLVEDVQTGQRGFVITGDERFLAPQRLALVALPLEFPRLRSLVRDPVQRARLDAIEAEAGELTDFSRQLVAVARRDRVRAARMIASGAGVRRLDAIRALFTQFDVTEQELVVRRDRDLKDTERTLIVLGGILLGGIVVLVGVFALVIVRRVVAPVTRLAAAARVVAGGDLSVTVPVGGAGEVGGLVGSFNAMTHALAESRARHEAVNRELEAFAYSVSHDLRGPLRAVDGFAQALDDDYADALDETSRDYLRRIRAGAQRMGLLIDDLLDLSRVGRAEMRRESVDVTALAHDVVQALRAGDPNRVVDVVIQPGIVADADPGLLRVVLQNLIANAWKFTRDADPARIEVGTSQDGGRATHFVRDNGAGFDMAYAHKLFAPFQRLHPDSQFPGTGVGLATVSRIVARHGGEVSADGRVGEGATFRFTLE